MHCQYLRPNIILHEGQERAKLALDKVEAGEMSDNEEGKHAEGKDDDEELVTAKP